LKVLVVDDEAVVLEMARATLEDMGHEVVTRNSALGASACILRERPEIVLVDIGMPALSGDEWLRLVGEQDLVPGERTPVFVLFSGAEPAELDRLVRETCAAGYISKQSGPNGLEERFRKIVEGLSA
jgi:CheY-like chemotaxis protein